MYMKKLVVIISATLLLIFALAGCGSKEVHTPPSLAVENTVVSTQASNTKEPSAVTEAVNESKNDGNAQDEDAPSLEDGDLEIITYVSTEGSKPEGGNDSHHTNTQPPAKTEGEAVTEANTEYEEAETTEREVIILPFVPAE